MVVRDQLRSHSGPERSLSLTCLIFEAEVVPKDRTMYKEVSGAESLYEELLSTADLH